MRRRTLTRLLAGASLWPFAADAQVNPEAPKLGFLYPGPKEAAAARVDALVGGVRASGYAVPQLELVVRVAEGDPARIAPMVAEVMAKRVAVIMAVGRPVLEAARAATNDIPIVAVDLESDPIASGFADSIARPGHNLTGVFLDFPDFAAKLLQLLVESAPGMQRVAVLWDPTTGPLQNDSVRRTAATLKLQTDVIEIRVRDDFERAFAQASQNRAEALLMLSSPLISVNVKILADLALKHRLPAITPFPDFARTGGMFAYGPNLLDMFRQSGVLVGKVLRGRDPADLPIERPGKFEFVLNSRTAEAMGFAIPAALLLRADEVIE